MTMIFIDQLLEMADNFYSIAIEMDGRLPLPNVDELNDQIKKEKQREAVRKSKQKIIELGKVNPKDPKYQEYLEKKREEKSYIWKLLNRTLNYMRNFYKKHVPDNKPINKELV